VTAIGQRAVVHRGGVPTTSRWTTVCWPTAATIALCREWDIMRWFNVQERGL